MSEDEQGLGVIRMNMYEWAFEEGLSAVTSVGTIPYGCGMWRKWCEKPDRQRL